MKKKLLSVMMAVPMAFLLLTTAAVPALAQSEEAVTVDSELMLIRALGIEAPRVAQVGEEVIMTVFQRGTEEPIKDAGVWALTRDEASALKEEIAQIRAEGESALEEVDYESLVSIRGTFLGRTNGHGQLKHTFEEKGVYLLVAVKRGYIPGHTPIGIRGIINALGIEAPRVAQVGEEVTMTVFQRGTEEPIKDAGVWALTRDEASVLKEEIAQIRAEGESALEEVDYESLVSIRGTFLGRTNGHGQLKHTFEEKGVYLLVAVKRGYIPGHTPIGIRGITDTLEVEASDTIEPLNSQRIIQ